MAEHALWGSWIRRIVLLDLLALLALPALAAAHAEISPKVTLAKQLQLYTLAVPTEKSGLATTKIVMTVPTGFGIDSFAPPPLGWKQQLQQSGSGDNALITRVTWTGGRTPTGQDSVFQFLAQPDSAKDYRFAVQQTYSDGSIVNWAGPESSEAPAPVAQVKSAIGGGGGTTTGIIALVISLLALAISLAGVALRRGSRPLA